jgi:hypothetical protein
MKQQIKWAPKAFTYQSRQITKDKKKKGTAMYHHSSCWTGLDWTGLDGKTKNKKVGKKNKKLSVSGK